MSLNAILSSFVRFTWIPDHVRVLSDIRPRHVGTTVTFEYFLSDDPEDYTSEQVTGVLEGVRGQTLIVANELFEWSNIKNMKVWRAEVKK